MPSSLSVGAFGKFGQPLLAPGIEHAQLAGFDQRREAGGIGRRHEVAAQDRLRQFGAALVGNVIELDADLLRDQLGGQVRAGQGAGRAVAELAGIGLGIGDEIVPVLDRAVGGHHDAERIARDVDDVADVLDRVPVDLGRVGQPEHTERNLRQRVAVRRGGLHLLGRQRAAGARLVLDDDRLAQRLRGVVRQRAHRDVGRPARRKSDDELDRSGRKSLSSLTKGPAQTCPGKARQARRQQAARVVGGASDLLL